MCLGFQKQIQMTLEKDESFSVFDTKNFEKYRKKVPFNLIYLR